MQNIEQFLTDLLKIPTEGITHCNIELYLKHIKKGDILLKEGDVCQSHFFVEKGLLRMFAIDGNAKEHIIQFAPENWLIGDRSSIFFHEKSNYFIEAIEDSEVYFLAPDFFDYLKIKFPNAMISNDLLLHKHIRTLQNRIHSLLSDSARERYQKFIKSYPNIMQRVPQWMVASYLGITPEGLSRVRKDMVKK